MTTHSTPHNTKTYQSLQESKNRRKSNGRLNCHLLLYC